MYFGTAFTLKERVEIAFYNMQVKSNERIHCAASEQIQKNLNGKSREYVEKKLAEVQKSKMNSIKKEAYLDGINRRLAEMEHPEEEAAEATEVVEAEVVETEAVEAEVVNAEESKTPAEETVVKETNEEVKSESAKETKKENKHKSRNIDPLTPDDIAKLRRQSDEINAAVEEVMKNEANTVVESAEVSEENTSANSSCGPRVEDAPIGLDFSGIGGFHVNPKIDAENPSVANGRLDPRAAQEPRSYNPAFDPKNYSPNAQPGTIPPSDVMSQFMPQNISPEYAEQVNPRTVPMQQIINQFVGPKVEVDVQHGPQTQLPVIPMPPVPPQQQMMIPQQQMIQPSMIIPQQPQPEAPKIPEENINIDLHNLDVKTDGSAQPKMLKNEAINNPIPDVDPEEVYQPLTPAFDNSVAIKSAKGSNSKHIAKVEEIALKCGYQIQMVKTTHGMINCYVYKPDNLNTWSKTFTIDPGMIGDERMKVYPFTCAHGYEQFNPYFFLIPNDKSSVKGKGDKNIVNEPLISAIIIGGADNIPANQRRMFGNTKFELNKFMAVITIPTKYGKEVRETITRHCVEAMNAGVFAEAKKCDPTARFRFDKFTDKDNFTLTTDRMSPEFGSAAICQRLIEIEFKGGNPTINHNPEPAEAAVVPATAEAK